MRRAWVWAVLLTASCSDAGGIPGTPPATDKVFDEGVALALPVEGEFPRVGIQWTYAVEHEGFGEAADFPARIGYRLTARQGGALSEWAEKVGHPWGGWWMYGADRGSAFTGATIWDVEVYFHPPRHYGFRCLEWAPWPVASPGTPQRIESILRLGKGWGEHEGREIPKVRNDLGPREVSVAAGTFPDAWYVEGESPGWKGRFWWVARVGWARMEFAADDGRRIHLALLSVRQVASP